MQRPTVRPRPPDGTTPRSVQRTVSQHAEETGVATTAVRVAARLRTDADLLRRTAMRNIERHPELSRAIADTAEHLLLTADALVHLVNALEPPGPRA